MMIDIEHLRQNPDLYRQAITAKQIVVDLDDVLQADAARRESEREVQRLRELRNKLSAAVAKQKDDKLIAEAKLIGERLAPLEERLRDEEARFRNLVACVPNLPLADVPVGATDADNVEVRKVGQPRDAGFALRDHIELCALHNLVEFEAARKVAGSRAYAMTGLGALLQQAVMRFALDHITGKGFELILPPLAVTREAMFGTGYFPFGEDNAYHLERDDLFLTGTSEVGIVALQGNRTFDAERLPIKLTGISTCFRREAGAAGRDTRGLYRVHQFEKVEQIVIGPADPQATAEAHAALLQNAEEILQALELPYRVVEVCTGDMGLGQVKKHDIETWMPGRNSYGETHSCSSFFEFQARRLNIKYRDGKEKRFAHTLNNTAIAAPRILIPLLENHQNQDGSINIPMALRPYFGNRAMIG